MVELRLLGSLELTGGDASGCRAVLAQPKRLALLSYLAIAQGGGGHRRDRVVSVFWPELTDRAARGSLRKSLHFLRTNLGAGVVAGLGQEQVGISGEALRCDVLAFREAIRTRDYVRALELYRGDFLAGFFISDAPDFEHWLDWERQELRNQAAAAALALSEGASAGGDRHGAVHWARRALALSRHSEGTLQWLLYLLRGVGDRGAALQAYREFEDRLEAEFGAEPTVETRRLYEQIRDRSDEQWSVEPPAASGVGQPEGSGGPMSRAGGLEVATLVEPEAARGTPQPRATVTRAEEAGICQEIVEAASDIVYRANSDGYFTYVNPAAVAVMKYPREELIGRLYLELVREDFRQIMLEFYVRQLSEGVRNTYLEFPALTRDGREVWLGQNVQLVRSEGRVVGVQAIARDVTARRRADDALRNLSLVDAETGLYNRRAFFLLAEERMKMARRAERGLLLLRTRLRSWRGIRHHQGPVEGGKALVRAASVLRRTFRESDLLARTADDELVVLAIEETEETERTVTARLGRMLAQDAERAGDALPLEITVLRHGPTEARTASELLAPVAPVPD